MDGLNMTATKKRSLGDITNTASELEVGVPSTILRFALQRAAYELIPQERIKICLRYHKPNTAVITVNRHKTAKKAYFGGLMTCGSVWQCPLCAQRISEHRRAELERGVLNWTGGIFMVTYTASHKLHTPLKEILETVKEGARSFKSGEKFQTIKNAAALRGTVKALEVTYGANGWHPHIHEIWFVDVPLNKIELDVVEMALRKHWQQVLGRKGWLASIEHGIKVSDDKFDLARYVAKFGHEPKMTMDQWKNQWSLVKEVTKQVVKKSRTREGRTPTQLLVDYIQDDFEAGERWREYALTFKGSKQLTWSNGLRDLLKIGEEVGDAEITDELPEDTLIYATFSLDQWKAILRHDARAEILHRAEWMSQEDFALWVSEKIDTWL
jgi:hypothetical protein